MQKNKSTIIVPTILTNKSDEFQAAVVLINSFTKRVQIDVCDGEFSPNVTIGLDSLFWPDDWVVDLHLMVKTPSVYLERMILMKPNMIILHAEVEENLIPIFKKLKQAGIKTGLALLRNTVPATKADLIKEVDHVLIFAGTLGKMGGQASLVQVQKIKLIKKIKPTVEIGWDGGANMDNLATILRGGVNVVNVGSAISFSQNPAAIYKSMTDLVEKESIV